MKTRLSILALVSLVGSTANGQEINTPYQREFDIPRFFEQPFLSDSAYKKLPLMDSVVNMDMNGNIGGMKRGTLLDTREVTDDGIIVGGNKYFIRNAKPQIENKPVPVQDGSVIYLIK